MRILLAVIGFVAVGCGVIGLFVPLWPSTVFFLIAAALFAKSSPKAEKWLLEQPTIGSTLRNWREKRAISRSAKISATIAIALSFAISILVLDLMWLRIALALFALALIIFICTRTEVTDTMRAKRNDVA